MFFSQYFSFPCQYHSTNAPYSFIYLPPTLYKLTLLITRLKQSIPSRVRLHSTDPSAPIHSDATGMGKDGMLSVFLSAGMFISTGKTTYALTSRQKLLIVQMNRMPTCKARANCQAVPQDRKLQTLSGAADSQTATRAPLWPSRGAGGGAVRLPSYCTWYRKIMIF